MGLKIDQKSGRRAIEPVLWERACSRLAGNREQARSHSRAWLTGRVFVDSVSSTRSGIEKMETL